MNTTASTALNARTLTGLADICELVAASFAYPADGRLAAALADGSYALDARGCLADAGLGAEAIERGLAEIGKLTGRNAAELADALKKGHSLLFLAPGSQVPVWPYEAAFRFVASGRSGAPSLFRSPIELDVECHMREAGVMPQNSRTEPPDSIWNEFSFMAYLFAQALSTLQAGDMAAGDAWVVRAQDFEREHLAAWVPAFMEKATQEAASGHHPFGAEYAALAQVGALAWEALGALGHSERA